MSTTRPSLTALRAVSAPVVEEGAAEERAPEEAAKPDPKRTAADNLRLTKMVGLHFDFIWRSLRRLGVPSTDIDDCVQQVFWVAARKLGVIQQGSERAFLFSTALRVASDARRSRTRRREVPFSGSPNGEEAASMPSDPAPRPDEMADQKRARAMLDEVLAAMEIDLRTVFVLFELEEMPTQEIANLLDIPAGTVASRLRRAREEFQRLVARLRQGSKALQPLRSVGKSGAVPLVGLRGGGKS